MDDFWADTVGSVSRERSRATLFCDRARARRSCYVHNTDTPNHAGAVTSWDAGRTAPLPGGSEHPGRRLAERCFSSQAMRLVCMGCWSFRVARESAARLRTHEARGASRLRASSAVHARNWLLAPGSQSCRNDLFTLSQTLASPSTTGR
jgi:hypothetical protein